jgi:hypothetical protein
MPNISHEAVAFSNALRFPLRLQRDLALTKDPPGAAEVTTTVATPAPTVPLLKAQFVLLLALPNRSPRAKRNGQEPFKLHPPRGR